MRVCCQMGLYPALAKGGTPKNLVQLGEATGADTTLLRMFFGSLKLVCLISLILITVRFLRASVCFGAVKEASPETYTLSASYSQFGDPKVAAAMPKL